METSPKHGASSDKVSAGHDVHGDEDKKKVVRGICGYFDFTATDVPLYVRMQRTRRLRFTRHIGIPVDRCPAV